MNVSSKHKIPIFVGLGLIFPILALACTLIIPGNTTILMPDATIPAATAAPTPTQVPIPASLTDEETTLVNLYARANSSVVNVTVFSEQGGGVLPLSQGSGFLYDDAGNIVTNAHVVQDADLVEVTFSDGTIRPANVLGEDLNSDLAVIKVDRIPQGVGPLPLGDMSTLAVGQTVVAIGNPFGLEGTLTHGIISALGRTIPALTPFSIPQSIQTDAAINPGNSGGPLLNLAGQVIGVNAQIETDGASRSNSGVGFAIPVSIVHLVVPDLIQNGVHEWSWLGVRGGSFTPGLVEAMDLPVERGAYIVYVEEEGPADIAGMRGSDETVDVNGRRVDIGGDAITAIDNQSVRSFEDLLIYIAMQTRPGQQVTLTILRDGKYQDLVVTLASRPDTLERFPNP